MKIGRTLGFESGERLKRGPSISWRTPSTPAQVLARHGRECVGVGSRVMRTSVRAPRQPQRGVAGERPDPGMPAGAGQAAEHSSILRPGAVTRRWRDSARRRAARPDQVAGEEVVDGGVPKGRVQPPKSPIPAPRPLLPQGPSSSPPPPSRRSARTLARAANVSASHAPPRGARAVRVLLRGPADRQRPPGSHHVLARVFKDIFPRYQTMRGRYVERKAAGTATACRSRSPSSSSSASPPRPTSSATASPSSTRSAASPCSSSSTTGRG
jgi:hypothetical protein